MKIKYIFIFDNTVILFIYLYDICNDVELIPGASSRPFQGLIRGK